MQPDNVLQAAGRFGKQAQQEAAAVVTRAEQLKPGASAPQAKALDATEQRARAAEKNLLHQLDAVERELEKAKKKQQNARGLMAKVIGATVPDQPDIRPREIGHRDDIVPEYDEYEEKPKKRGFFGRLADRFAQADINKWHASAELQEVEEKLRGKDGKSGVQAQFDALADDSAEKRVHALRREKAEVQKKLGESTRGMLSFIKSDEERWELIGTTDAKEQEYNEARAELVADSLQAALDEQLGDMDARSEVLNKSQNALMDTLNTSIFGDNVTVRRAITMALSAGAIGAAATGFGAGALGLIGARRIFAGGLAAGGAYAGMAALESRGIASQIKGDSNAVGWRAKAAEYLRNVRPEDMKELTDDEVADYLAHAQELAVTRGIRPSSDALVQSLFAESGRRTRERIKTVDSGRVADAVQSYLKGADARAEEAIRIVAANDTKRKLAAAAGAAFVASGAFAKVVHAIGDFVLPDANAQELDADGQVDGIDAAQEQQVQRFAQASMEASRHGSVGSLSNEAALKLGADGYVIKSDGASIVEVNTGDETALPTGTTINISYSSGGYVCTEPTADGGKVTYRGANMQEALRNREAALKAAPPETQQPASVTAAAEATKREAAKKAALDSVRKEVGAEAAEAKAPAEPAVPVARSADFKEVQADKPSPRGAVAPTAEVRANKPNALSAELQRKAILGADALPKTPDVEQYNDFIQAAAKKYNVPPELLKAIMSQESKGNPDAESGAGAKGLMQIMPGTAKDLGVTDRTDPEQSINGGADYIAKQLSRYNGNVQHALMAYNWGPGNVNKWIAAGSDPNKMPAETREYVVRVLGYYDRYGGDFSAFGGDDVLPGTFQAGVPQVSRSTGSERLFTTGDNATAQEADSPYKEYKPTTADVLRLKAEYEGLPFAQKVDIAFDPNKPDVEREGALRAIVAKHGRAIYYKDGEVYLPQRKPAGAQRIDIFAYPDKLIVEINGVKTSDFDQLPSLKMHVEPPTVEEVVSSSAETSGAPEIDPDAEPLQEASLREQKKSLKALVEANGAPRGQSFRLEVEGGTIIAEADGDMYYERPGGRILELQTADDLNRIPGLAELLDAADPNSEVAQSRADLALVFAQEGAPLGDTGTTIVQLDNGDHILKNTDGQMYYQPENGTRMQLVTAEDYAKLPPDVASHVVERPPAVVAAQLDGEPSVWDDVDQGAEPPTGTPLEQLPSELDRVTQAAAKKLPDFPQVPDITQVENPFRDPTPSEASKKIAKMAIESAALDDAPEPELGTEQQRFIDDIQDAVTKELLAAEKARVAYEEAVAKDRSPERQQEALTAYEKHVEKAKQLISAGEHPDKLNKKELAAVRSYGIDKPDEATGSRILADAVAAQEAPRDGELARGGRRAAKIFERMALAIRNADDVINGATGNEQIIKGVLNAQAENHEEIAQWWDEYAAAAENPVIQRRAELRAEMLRAKADHIDESTEIHLSAQDARAEARIDEESFADRRFGEGLRYTQTYAEFERYNTPALRKEAIDSILADNYESYVRRHVNTAIGPATRNTNSDYNTVTVWDGGPVNSRGDVDPGASSTIWGSVTDDVQNATAEARQPRDVITPEDRLVRGLEDDAVRLYAAIDRIVAIEDELALTTDPARIADLEQQKDAVERFIVSGVQSIERRYSTGGSGTGVFRDSVSPGKLTRKQRIIKSFFEVGTEGAYRDNYSLDGEDIHRLPES